MKPNNIARIACSSRSHFFRMWVEFLAPWHKLAPREMDVFARVLEQYYVISKKVQDPELIPEVMWTNASRKDMRESLGMTQPHFQMILKALKDAGVLVDDKINKRFIPHLTEDPRFGFFVMFDWSSLTNPVNGQKQD